MDEIEDILVTCTFHHQEPLPLALPPSLPSIGPTISSNCALLAVTRATLYMKLENNSGKNLVVKQDGAILHFY